MKELTVTLKLEPDEVTILAERLAELLAILKNRGGTSKVVKKVLNQVENQDFGI